MSEDWRQRARKRVGARVDARVEEILAEAPLSSDEFETAMRENQLEAMQAVDPEAQLLEELTLRLKGDEIRDGLLLPGTADPIVRRLQALLPVVSNTKIELGLIGISTGSTVLHLRPVYSHRTRQPEDEDSSLAKQAQDDVEKGPSGARSDEPKTVGAELDRFIDGKSPVDHPERAVAQGYSSPVDYAMQELIKLIGAAENDEEFEAPRRILAAFEELINTLEKHSIDVDLGWQAATGRVRTGQLTSRGRRIALRRMRPQIRRFSQGVQGYVTELSAPNDNATVVVRSSINRKRGGYRIHMSRIELIQHALAFGEWVNLLVNVEESIDPLSGKTARSYVFHELVDRRRN